MSFVYFLSVPCGKERNLTTETPDLPTSRPPDLRYGTGPVRDRTKTIKGHKEELLIWVGSRGATLSRTPTCYVMREGNTDRHLMYTTCHLAYTDCHLPYTDCHLTHIDRHLTYIGCHLTYIDYHLMYIDRHFTYIDCHLMYIDCHLTYIDCHLMYIDCHKTYIDRLEFGIKVVILHTEYGYMLLIMNE